MTSGVFSPSIFAIVFLLLCCASRRAVPAPADQDPGWEVARSMGQTFDGPDVGQTWGELLLMGIDFADKKRGVIGGFNDPTELLFNNRFQGMVGYTEDGGKTFKFIKTRTNVLAVEHGAGDTFWAVGYNKLLLRTDDAGKTWKEVRGSGHSCRDMMQAHFRDTEHGVIAACSRRVYATDDGAKFRTVKMPDPSRGQKPGGKRPNAISAVAVGKTFGVAAGGDGELLVTNDGGATWEAPPAWRKRNAEAELVNKVPNWFRNAAVAGDAHAWIVGDGGIVVRTTDGGKTFDVTRIPGNDFFTAVRFADTRHGWILGWHNAYRTEDGGETWRMQPNAGGVFMNGLSVLDAHTAWIAGHYGCIQHTTDGGKNWRTLNDYTDLYAVAMIDDKLGYAGADSGAILKTTDGGRTWAFLDVPRGSAIEAIQFRDANTGWAVGDFGHIIYTTDGGATWKTGSIDFRDIIKDLHFFDAQRGVVVGAKGAIFTTDNGGATWQRVDTPTDRMLYGVDFPTPQTGYACGSGVILKTNDGGATWAELASPSIEILSDVRFVNETDGLVVGDIGQMFVTLDGGATWQQKLCPTREWLHHIEVVDDKTVLVAGSRGTILRSTDGLLTWTMMKTGARNNVYCISKNVAVGRWGQVQIMNPGALAAPPATTERAAFPEYESVVLPPGVSNVPQGIVDASFEVDDKGRLAEVTVNGRLYPTSKQFPTFTVLVMKDGRPDEVKELGPDDKSWTITPVDAGAAQNERAFIYRSDLLTVRVSYTGLYDRLVVKTQVMEENQGRLLKVSSGDGQFVRLVGDTPDLIRKGALAVPVDGGELIPFTAFTISRNELHKVNSIGGWTFKSRMIGFTDGRAGLVLRSHQWHGNFHYGQGTLAGAIGPTPFLYMGWSFDTRVDSAENVAEALENEEYGDAPPAWLTDPLQIDTFGFDLQYVGDINGDKAVNWADAGVTYREGNYKRSRMIDENPAMCAAYAQAPTCFMLWDNPFLGNTHSDSRALKRARDGRPSYMWGAWSRSVAYEYESGRLARFFDKLADDFDFPPPPIHLGTDTWTCGGGGTDFSADHPGTREESIRAKIATLQLLARRGYRTDSEALSEWGLAGNLLWGWWTPYVGNGVWPGGFTRCWDHMPTKKGLDGPIVSHIFAKPIPMQTVLFQGVTYHGAGSSTPPGYAILHGSRPQRNGIAKLRHNEFFYYPWIVLWKAISPYRATNVRELGDDLWEFTYENGSVLKLDVRTNTWVLKKDDIVYDGYSPVNPSEDPIKSAAYWGVPYENFNPPFPVGSFGVWRNGTFTIKVPGVRAVGPPRVVGAPEKDQPPPAYVTEYGKGVLSITIKDKDPVAHPMLVFEATEPAN